MKRSVKHAKCIHETKYAKQKTRGSSWRRIKLIEKRKKYFSEGLDYRWNIIVWYSYDQKFILYVFRVTRIIAWMEKRLGQHFYEFEEVSTNERSLHNIFRLNSKYVLQYEWILDRFIQ